MTKNRHHIVSLTNDYISVMLDKEAREALNNVLKEERYEGEISEDAFTRLEYICTNYANQLASAKDAIPISHVIKELESYEEIANAVFDSWTAPHGHSDEEFGARDYFQKALNERPVTITKPTERMVKDTPVLEEWLGAPHLEFVLTPMVLFRIATQYREALDLALSRARAADEAESTTYKKPYAHHAFYFFVYEWAKGHNLPTKHSKNEYASAPLSHFITELLKWLPAGFGQKKAIKIQSISSAIIEARKIAGEKNYKVPKHFLPPVNS